jgi:hypothetical protein
MAQARSKGTLPACNFAGKSYDNLLVEATLCFPRLRSLGFSLRCPEMDTAVRN